MPERGDLLLAEGGAGGDRAMESAVQHGTAPFVTGLQAPGTRSNLAAATGAWRYGKRSAFPTSPHPRRRRTNVERRVTLTFHLVQKICQVTVFVFVGHRSACGRGLSWTSRVSNGRKSR